MTSFLRHRLWPAAALLLALTLVTGVVYPLVVTVIAQVAFPAQANGSYVVTGDGRTIGSSLIGQAFSQPGYVWGRPSAAGAIDENPLGYDGMSSAGSNLGPTSQDLLDRIAASVDALRAEHGDAPIPVELVRRPPPGWTPTSARRRPITRSPGSRRRAGSPRTRSARPSDDIPRSRPWASSGSRGSMSCW